MIALDQPTKQPYRTREERYQHSQHQVDVLDITGTGLTTVPLQRLAAATTELPFDHLAEDDREASKRARELGLNSPVWRLTFQALLNQTRFTTHLQRCLHQLEQAYGQPVDTEFTLRLDDQGAPHINLVQCRPLGTLGADRPVDWPRSVPGERVLFQTRGHFMGGTMDWTFNRIIWVDAEAYAPLSHPQKQAVAGLIGDWNRHLASDDRVLMIGPGRWGASSPELGVPVRFSDIHRANVLVEVADLGRGLVPELSYGSHFFMDLVENQTGYVALFPHQSDQIVQLGPLADCPTLDHPVDSEAAQDDAVARCLRVIDADATPLRLVSDLVTQRSLCWWPE